MKSLRKYGITIALIAVSTLVLMFTHNAILLAVVSGIIIVIGALMLAWGAESSEFIISQGLALAIVAWLQIFPEFMIEATIAWSQDVPNMLANFTGANRILMGVGWPLVYFTTLFFSWRNKKSRIVKTIRLKEEHSIEIISLLIPTIYFFVIYFKHSITLLDSAVLFGIYIAYLYIVRRLPHLSRKKDRKLLKGVPRAILNMKKFRTVAIIVLFLIGGIAIFLVAEPFYTSMLAVATSLGISQFIFIQWIAPFLSEFPEKTSAFYWAKQIKFAPMAVMNLISSKIAQWTALTAMIPIVYSLSLWKIAFIPVSGILDSELLLSIATTLYAASILLKLRFHLVEAISLFVLWIAQFVFIDLRPEITIIYFVLFAAEIIVHRKDNMRAFSGYSKMIGKYVWGRKK
jgi:cation:H+ antiporter